MKNILGKIILTVSAFIMLWVFSACGVSRFVFAASVVDGAEVTRSEYTFKASATYGSEPCALTATCNGVLLSENDGEYTAVLSKGGNDIVLTAKSGGAYESRNYTVYYRSDLKIVTDLENAKTENDIITFAASAFFNDSPCAVSVSCNGGILSPNNGSYSATLEKGENKIVITGRSGDASETKEWSVFYEGFTVITDLTSHDTAQARLTFRANAVYGTEVCSLSVTVNGRVLGTQGGNAYTFAFTDGGEYEVVLTAFEGNMVFTKSYTVRYSDRPPYFEELTLEEGKELRGSTYTFSVIAKDALGTKLDNSQLTFEVDTDADDGRENFVTLAGSDLRLVWSDSERSSYRLNLNKGVFANCKGTPFLLRVKADAFGNVADRTFKMTYVGPGPNGEIGEIAFALEGFSINCGYFMEPQYISVYEGEPFARTLCDIITEQGWTYANTGTPESGFYLSSIIGLDLTGNRVADSLKTVMERRGCSLHSDSIEYDGSPVRLGEFNYCQGSGWMYSVNGIHPNYGFSDYYPQDGDTVRVQFTVWYGSDLGGGSAVGGGGANFFDGFADYAYIMKEIADIKANGYYGKEDIVFKEVLQAVSVWNVTQTEVDAQLKKLQETYGGGI